ncbi:phage holin family protein [Microbacterium dextranolyticum]|nr:phage holin family protein [Microbacterium dextranolyticum]MBM7463654.1 MFS family permease [Microbacterium dextranolyticum]
MIMFLLRALIFLVSAAVGLLVADLVLPGFTVDWRNPGGFVLAIVIFAVLQSVLAPWLARVAQRNAPAFLGGIGIVSTFVALLVTAIIPNAGLTIGQPWWTWIVAPMIVWVVTAIATFLLPALFLKKKVQERRS